MVFDRIKRWFLLRKARKLEEKHVPSKKEIEKEHKHFMKEAKDLEKEMKR